MKSKTGMTEKELGRTKDRELDWMELERRDYSNDEDCTDWKFRFYAINKKSYFRSKELGNIFLGILSLLYNIVKETSNDGFLIHLKIG